MHTTPLLAALLSIGDPAPPLDVAHWLKGDAVTGYQPGHVYVVEFWATWCGPCVANMEHLSEIQEKHARRGLTVIGVSDEPLSKTVAFLFRPAAGDGDPGRVQNDRTRYALATDPDRSVHRDYMEATSRRGIPVAYVVGKDGRLEWYGHPRELEDVVEAVLADRWSRDVVRADFERERRRLGRFNEATARLRTALEDEQWDAAIEAIDVILEEQPDRIGYIPTKLGILLSRLGDDERGYAYAEQVMLAAWNDNPITLNHVAWVTSGMDDYPIDDDRRDLDLALKASRRANVLTEWNDWGFIERMATIQHQRGEHADAARRQQQALDVFDADAATWPLDAADDIRRMRMRMEEKLLEYRARTLNP